MKKGHCILVFGVSGVGKTVSCEDFSLRHPNYLYTRASKLLSEASSESSEKLRTSDADRVISNQKLLISRFWEFRKGQLDRPILLDAHAVIDNDATLIKVPVQVVTALEPAALILLEAPINLLVQRRASGIRQRPPRTPEQLRLEMNAESQAVKEYSRELRVPLAIGNVLEDFRLDELINKVAPLD